METSLSAALWSNMDKWGHVYKGIEAGFNACRNGDGLLGVGTTVAGVVLTQPGNVQYAEKVHRD